MQQRMGAQQLSENCGKKKKNPLVKFHHFRPRSKLIYDNCFFFLSPVPALHSRMRARQYTYFCTPSTTLQLQLRAIRYTGMLITYRNYFSFFLSFYFVYLFTFFNFLCLISPPAPSRHRRRAIAATIIPPVFFFYIRPPTIIIIIITAR